MIEIESIGLRAIGELSYGNLINGLSELSETSAKTIRS